MNKEKDFKHYAMIFIMASVAIGIFVVIQIIQNGTNFEPNSLVALLIIPITFTFFLFVFDKVLNAVLPKSWKPQANQTTDFELFIINSTNLLAIETQLSIEERRRLFEDDKFNKALSQIFTIKKHGESEHLSYSIILKKYKNSSKEHKALSTIIDSTIIQ